MVTLAPETAAREGSVTKPLISPLVCARPATVDIVNNSRPPKIWKTKRVLFVILPPSFPLVFEKRLHPGQQIQRCSNQDLVASTQFEKLCSLVTTLCRSPW